VNSMPHIGRALPHNPDAEASILGGIILQNEVLERLDTLEVSDFYDLKNQVVFQAIRNLVAKGRPIDVLMLEAEIVGAGKLDAIGGPGYLGELALKVPTPENVEHYRDLVKLDARNRRVMNELGAALDRARRGVYEPGELLIETIGELQRIEQDWRGPAAIATSRAKWAPPLESFLGNEEPDDDDSADWILRDIIPRGEASLIAGPPKCGKTWAMLGMAIDIALGMPWLDRFDHTLGRPGRVLCIPLEDGPRRLRKRVWELARARGVTPNDPRLRANLRISREPLSLPGDERALAAELKAWKPDVVLTDNLTRVMVGDQNAIKDAKRFCDVWSKLCTDVGAAFTFLHHTSKVGPIKPEQRGQGDPFELVRGSGDFVGTARHIVLMRPLESPDAMKISDVRMRGNLDLRREDFVLGFDRAAQNLPAGPKWVASLGFRGELEAVQDEIAAKKREKQAARKAGRGANSTLGADGANTADERIYAAIVRLCATGARELCTYEQITQSCGVRKAEVRPALDRLVHAGRVRAEVVKRNEGGGVRKRTVFVPTNESSS